MDQYPKGHDNRSVAISSYKEYNYILIDDKRVIVDTDGIPHDERIHTKNKSKHDIREMGISVGWKVTESNDINNFDRSTINYDYYVMKTEEIVKPLRKI